MLNGCREWLHFICLTPFSWCLCKSAHISAVGLCLPTCAAMATSKLHDLAVDCVCAHLDSCRPFSKCEKMWVCVYKLHTCEHLAQYVFSFFGLPEDFAIPFGPLQCLVHSLAPQGMFTFQKLSMWTQLVQKERKCVCTAAGRGVKFVQFYHEDVQFLTS